MLNSTPANWAASEIPTSTKMNTEVKQAFTDLQAAWTSWSPTWTSSGTAPAIGNGTLVGTYTRIGKFFTGTISLTWGSTTTAGTGNYLFSLPVTAAGGIHTPFMGQAELFDTSAATYNYYVVALNTSAQIVLRAPAAGALASATAPYTWATGDGMMIQFQGQAA